MPFFLNHPLKTTIINSKKYVLGFGTVSVAVLANLTGCQKPQDNTAATKDSASSVSASSASTTPNNAVSSDSKLTIYTATNVWGSVAKAVGGDHVDVIMAVNDPTQDPHEYQASANDKLNITKSSIVLVNGGGYDDWTTSLAKSVANKPVIINAVDLSGLAPASQAEHNAHADEQHDESEHAQDTAHTSEAAHDDKHEHHHGEFNEHVFFSLDTAKKVAQAVANVLAQRDPANKTQYVQNAADFMQKIDTLKAKAQAVGQGKNLTAFATEPVTGYLLQDMGIKNVTPEGFVAQSETDAGVSVKVMNDSQLLLKNKQVNLLIVNAQTEDATAKQLENLAQQSGIAVVPVYETFPQGVTTYTDFMEKTIDSIAQAVKQ